jgi:3-deoxy-D-manno-octulosonate 8-phosphate phosphatase (KDO 8-P phosphatase)
MSQELSLWERCKQTQLLILDVDGVLTDGSVIYSDSGEELKRFHVRDGAGIKVWQQSGRQVAILSGRSSTAVTRRATELGITIVLQGQADKLAALHEIQRMTGVEANLIAAMGDDLPDLPLLRSVGLAISVEDACDEVRNLADYTTLVPGGHGAVREAIEWLLKQSGEWEQLLPR